MKNITYYAFLLLLLVLTSCLKEAHCRDGIVGTYLDVISSSDPAISSGQYIFEVKAGSGETEVLITFEFEDANNGQRGIVATLEGNLSDNCNVLEIPTQTFDTQIYNGTLSTANNQLKGFINGNGTIVNVEMDRQ